VYVKALYFWIAKMKTKDSAPIIASIPHLQSELNFFLNIILIIKVVSKYLNCSTLSKELLLIFIL